MKISENQLKLLLAFLTSDDKTVSYAQFARNNEIPKYEVSRLGKQLVEMRLINTDDKKPFLTELGIEYAEDYANKLEIITQYLSDIGINENEIKDIAYKFVLMGTNSVFDALEQKNTHNQIKTFLVKEGCVTGVRFCHRIHEGIFELPIRFIKMDFEPWGTHTHLSPATEMFQKLCVVYIHKGRGKMNVYPSDTPSNILDYAEEFQYWNGGKYIPIQIQNDTLSIPLDDFHFTCFGTNAINSVIEGTIEIRIKMKEEYVKDGKVPDCIRTMLSVVVD